MTEEDWLDEVAVEMHNGRPYLVYQWSGSGVWLSTPLDRYNRTEEDR